MRWRFHCDTELAIAPSAASHRPCDLIELDGQLVNQKRPAGRLLRVGRRRVLKRRRRVAALVIDAEDAKDNRGGPGAVRLRGDSEETLVERGPGRVGYLRDARKSGDGHRSEHIDAARR